jgi:hypothetical protein
MLDASQHPGRDITMAASSANIASNPATVSWPCVVRRVCLVEFVAAPDKLGKPLRFVMTNRYRDFLRRFGHWNPPPMCGFIMHRIYATQKPNLFSILILVRNALDLHGRCITLLNLEALALGLSSGLTTAKQSRSVTQLPA